MLYMCKLSDWGFPHLLIHITRRRVGELTSKKHCSVVCVCVHVHGGSGD